MSATIPLPDTPEVLESPERTAQTREFRGLPYDPENPTVAGSIALAFQIINRERGLAS